MGNHGEDQIQHGLGLAGVSLAADGRAGQKFEAGPGQAAFCFGGLRKGALSRAEPGSLGDDHSRHAPREQRRVQDAMGIVVGKERDAAVSALADLGRGGKVAP
jgi:hypothetical protein